MRDLHKEITGKIVGRLKDGVMPWRKPWSDKATGKAPAFMPRNAVTGRAYSGVNILLLWGRSDDADYTDSRWLTFKQAKELGGSVRKGEKGTEIVFVNFVERESRNDPDKTVRIPFLKSYYVFNVSQCDGLPEKIVTGENAPERAPVKRNARDETIDAFIAATGASVRHGEPRAYYATVGDFVNLPVFASFTSSHAYYATAFHELGHWTGAEHRLNRQFGKRFGDRAYAAEELVAELTSAFVSAEFGIDNTEQNASYVASWLKGLTEFLETHDRAIVTAASAASRAVEFLRGKASAEEADLPLAA